MKKALRPAVATYDLFNEADGIRAINNSTDATKDFLTSLMNRGPVRELQLPPEDYLNSCLRLRDEMPNFEGYINDVLIPDLTLCHKARRPTSLTRVLFVGSPGIGKTLFASRLADALSLPFDRINLEAAQASFEITGVARGWSTCGPGRLLRWLADGHAVNGIFAFEELDKDRADSRFPASNAMLQLLENSTASKFADNSSPELKLNLQPVNYVFTANTLDGISKPLLSRLLVVEVPDLTQEQARGIAQRQYRSLLDSLGLGSQAPELSDDALDQLAQQSPRRQRMLLRLALGRALASDAGRLELPATPKRPTSMRMGFY